MQSVGSDSIKGVIPTYSCTTNLNSSGWFLFSFFFLMTRPPPRSPLFPSPPLFRSEALQAGAPLAQRRAPPHQAAVALPRERTNPQPAQQGDGGRPHPPAGLLPGGEPLKEEM